MFSWEHDRRNGWIFIDFPFPPLIILEGIFLHRDMYGTIPPDDLHRDFPVMHFQEDCPAMFDETGFPKLRV